VVLQLTLDKLRKLDPILTLGYVSPLPFERDNQHVRIETSEMTDDQVRRVVHVYYRTLTTQIKIICLTIQLWSITGYKILSNNRRMLVPYFQHNKIWTRRVHNTIKQEVELCYITDMSTVIHNKDETLEEKCRICQWNDTKCLNE
jgi:hypothetical protein